VGVFSVDYLRRSYKKAADEYQWLLNKYQTVNSSFDQVNGTLICKYPECIMDDQMVDRDE
jgi:hypothetical protein